MIPQLIIDGFDYDPLLRKLEKETRFYNGQPWDEMLDSVLNRP